MIFLLIIFVTIFLFFLFKKISKKNFLENIFLSLIGSSVITIILYGLLCFIFLFLFCFTNGIESNDTLTYPLVAFKNIEKTEENAKGSIFLLMGSFSYEKKNIDKYKFLINFPNGIQLQEIDALENKNFFIQETNKEAYIEEEYLSRSYSPMFIKFANFLGHDLTGIYNQKLIRKTVYIPKGSIKQEFEVKL